MKKITTLAMALLFLVGCSSNPPKIGIIINKDTPIELSEKSSEAMKILNDFGEVGVRDLTREEFEQHQADIEKFNALIGEQQKFNRLAYEAGGIGLGLAAGLSGGLVLGYAAVTTIFSNDLPDNYDFAWDFNTTPKVYSRSGVDNSVLLGASKQAVAELALELEFSDKLDGLSFDIQTNESKERGKLSPSLSATAFKKANEHKNKVTALGFCFDTEKKCHYDAGVIVSGKSTVLGAILVSKIAANLPDDYYFYLPPNKSLNRLPMLIHGGTGEIEYLAEKE